jgi:hypothetical protein
MHRSENSLELDGGTPYNESNHINAAPPAPSKHRSTTTLRRYGPMGTVPAFQARPHQVSGQKEVEERIAKLGMMQMQDVKSCRPRERNPEQWQWLMDSGSSRTLPTCSGCTICTYSSGANRHGPCSQGTETTFHG